MFFHGRSPSNDPTTSVLRVKIGVRSELDNRVKLGIAGGKSGDREREITIVSGLQVRAFSPHWPP
jgi:hypothetical protein